ncbi:MAG: DUF4350 domain-containing protein [Saprospiraceae bacterium]|nr:DUF4350 domain-containing protein [Saprospiraceae bacterium]
MSRQRLYILGGIAVVFLLLYLLFGNSGQQYSWKEDYHHKSRDPYGVNVLFSLLDQFIPGGGVIVLKDSLNGSFSQHDTPKASYVFSGAGMYMTERDRNALLQFVSEGNQAFISCNTIPHDLMFYLYLEECGTPWDGFHSIRDTLVRLNLDHPDLIMSEAPKYQYLNNFQIQSYPWRFMGSEYFCDKDTQRTILGYVIADSSYINFARVKHGAGYFYLHTTPLAFTNYHLIRKEGLEYARRVFAHLPEGQVYWDEYSRVPESVTRLANQRASDGPPEISQESPLKYVLSQPALTWAWYLLLGTVLLYLLFRAKRRQQIVPVVERNTNTSLEFVQTIGQLYFLQNNHQKLAMQKIRLFNGFIREKYNLNYREGDEQFFARLAARSEVPETLIRDIFSMQETIKKAYAIGTAKLIDFHRLMDQFYKICK